MKNILIVEDSKLVSNQVKRELVGLGYSCYQAYNFQTAKQHIEDVVFDLVILDLHLPDGEGYDLILQIQSLTDSKVVILTGNSEKQLREELFHHGILDYIIKDKNLSYALKELHKVLEHIEETYKHNVLIIDDSKFICKQIENILLPRNYNVTIASTAQDGIDKLESGNFDLVTLDMELPDMHGSDVLEEIKSQKKFADLPILIISGTSDSDVVRKIYKKGGSDFIRKPFIVEEFALKVDLWIDYRKKHKEALEQKDRLLSQQSKMATMGEMLENIIHQSRQPLSVITSIASGLTIEQQIEAVTPEKLLDNLDTIIDSAQHLSDTMTGFRNFYKSESTKLDFDLTKLLEKAFNLTKSKFHNREIHIEKDFEMIKMFGYDIELLQVFINILNNARDEFEKHQQDDKTILIRTRVIDENVVISFQDNAGGIPENIIGRIFDAHFTTKGKEEGTGVGLYMSQEIVKKHHDGEITVTNEPFMHNGKEFVGAKFTVTIPLHQRNTYLDSLDS
jgi:DNA-binding response OmpR family regulator